ncbi:C-GCAxxG-C-C family (seleno)protein [Clostridium uliginosum]|uniref:C_GCAxxG_C_C family probable redox protein n=1 Tax=Clostridium uliginosum TaxID=119641 RepID=A0A1I1GRA2_9CLOT|nr:C-GCAxxG-C-C family (seleno)protein [Clostridium uliginosum]SFC13822.1 C_GCAxxG_C_C family probable redox protein [Clostridium uliginosum]
MACPSEYLSKGYNCAESLIKSYNEEHNQNIPLGLGSGMGAGVGVGSLCGAINAGIVIIGYLKGRNDNTETNMARNYSREFITTIKEKYSTEMCRELKANNISCAEIVDFSYNTLIKMLEK